MGRWASRVAVVAELALLAWLVFSPVDLKDEHRFYSIAQKREPFLLSDIIAADRLCVRPGGIGMLHDIAYPKQEDKKYAFLETRHYDSQEDWFMLAYSEQAKTVRVIPIGYDRAPLANGTEICADQLRVDFDANGQMAISVPPSQPVR